MQTRPDSHLTFSRFLTPQPAVSHLLQDVERHPPAVQHRVVEILDVEPGSQLLLRLSAQADEDRMTQFVAARLSRRRAVALNFPSDASSRVAVLSDEIFDGLLASPAQMMNSRVHHAAVGTEELRLEVAQPPERVLVVHPELIGQLLRVERPPLPIPGEATRLADERQVGVGKREPPFELMAGQALMEDCGGESESRPLRG